MRRSTTLNIAGGDLMCHCEERSDVAILQDPVR